MRALRVATGGLLLGVGWGVLARVYMRLVSTDPSFSWAGTMFIIGLAGLLGLSLGVVEAARRREGRGWWRLAALPGLLLFAGPGMPLLPAAALGGWAGSGRGPLVLRWLAAAVVAAVPIALFLLTSAEDSEGVSLPVAVGGFWILSALLALGGSVVFRRWPSRARRQAPQELAVA